VKNLKKSISSNPIAKINTALPLAIGVIKWRGKSEVTTVRLIFLHTIFEIEDEKFEV
jgi:hypothetical protein